MLLDYANVFLVCYNPHILNRADGLEAVDGELDEGTSHAHDVDELLWVIGGGHGPEAATYAACHDYDLYVVEFIHKEFTS